MQCPVELHWELQGKNAHYSTCPRATWASGRPVVGGGKDLWEVYVAYTVTVFNFSMGVSKQ